MKTPPNSHWSTWPDAKARQAYLDKNSNGFSKALNKVTDTYDKYLEDPIRKLPRWGQIGGFAALNAGGAWLGNQMPWVSEENQANPLLAAAIATPYELLEFDHINHLKDKYGTTKTSEAMAMPLYDAFESGKQRFKGQSPSLWDATKYMAEDYFKPYQDIYRKSNPLMKAGIMGSIAGGTAQLPISAYNSVMSLTGNKQLEINNDIGSAVAFGLGALAPLTMSLVNKARGKG